MATEPIGKFLPKAKGRAVDPEEDSRPNRTAAYIAGGILATGGLLAFQQHKILQHAAKTSQIAARREKGQAYREAIRKVTEVMKAPKAKPVDPHRSILEGTLQKRRHEIDIPQPTDPKFSSHVDRMMKKVHGPIEGLADIMATKTEKEAQKHVHGIKTQRINEMVETMVKGRAERVAESEARDRFHREVVTPVFKKHNLPTNLKDLSGLPKEDAERITRHVYSKEHREMIDPVNPPTKQSLKQWSESRQAAARQKTGKIKEPKGPGIRSDKRPMTEGGISSERYNQQQKRKKTTLSRLVNLIQFETRNKNGQFSTGEVLPDPRTMQYAYHGPNASGGFNFNGNGQKPRGRGRPPGSLNRRTLAQREVEEQAVSEQPEAKSPGLGLGAKALITAGAIGGAGLVLGPKLAPVFKASRRAAQAVERIGGRIGEPVIPGSTAIFGKSLATKAAKKGQPIEEAIVNRVENIARLKKERLKKAADWTKAHRDKPGAINPHLPVPDPDTGITHWPPRPPTKQERKTAAEIASARAGENVAKARLDTANEQIVNAQTKAQLNKAIRAREHYKTRVRDLGSQLGDAGKTVGELKQQLKKFKVDSKTGKTKAASINEALNEAATKTAPWHGLPDEPAAARARVRQSQDELFTIARPTSIPLGTSDLNKKVEAIKQGLLAGRGEEIAKVAAATKTSPEDVAVAMAHRQLKGELTQYAPALKRPGPLSTTREQTQYREGIKSQKSELLAPIREASDLIETKSKEAAQAAGKEFDKKLKGMGISKMNKRQSEERSAFMKEAADRAAHGQLKQLVSEKKLPKSYLRGVVPGYKAKAAELRNFSRPFQVIDRSYLRPGMIEFSEPILPAETLSAIERFLLKNRSRLKTLKLDPKKKVWTRPAPIARVLPG